MKRMFPKLKDNPKRSRPPTPEELWSGDHFPDYRSQMRHIITPFCECTAILDKGQRGGKHRNPGVPCLYLGPSHTNDVTERSYLVARYLDGKRFRVRHIIANEDRLPLRDGPSPGLFMCPSLGGRRGQKPLKPHTKKQNLELVSTLNQPDNQSLPIVPEDEAVVDWASDSDEETKTHPSALEETKTVHSDSNVNPDIKNTVTKTVSFDTPIKPPKIKPEEGEIEDEGEHTPHRPQETSVSESTVPITPMPPLEDTVIEELETYQDMEDESKLSDDDSKEVCSEPDDDEVVNASTIDKQARSRTKKHQKPHKSILKPIRKSIRYNKSSLIKSNRKLYPPGTEIQTLWGPAVVKQASSDNLNLTVWWHTEPGAVYTVKATQIWLEEDKPGLLYDSDNQIVRKQYHEIYHTDSTRYDSPEATFRGFKLDDLIGNVTALAVNDALPKH